MGGSKGDRKSYRATSSAKAAEALAAKGGAGLGFGGFSGSRPVAGFGFGAPAAAAAATAAGGSADGSAGASTGSTAAAAAGGENNPLELSAQLDGELAQCLRHLSKRDTTTKLKALQNLEELIPTKSPAALTVMLQPWAYHFKRLLLDPAKAVRIKAAAVMAAVAAGVGKALAPQLKSLLGPWFLASFDPYPDAAAAARRSLEDVFPGRKQLDALMFCRSEVLAHIATCLTATPQSLGDPVKDTPEELQDRHERILTASLAAAAALLTTMQQAASSTTTSDAPATAAAPAAAAALQDVQDKVSEMLATPGFFKQKLGSKSSVVQRAAYGFIQAVCSAAPQLLKPCLSAASPAVLGALQDKEPSNHPAMWEMLLAFVTSQKPDCWAAVNVQKAVVPRLLSLLRHGCYGSLATSLPALLPFLTQLPRSALALQPLLLLDQVLESIWIGQQQQGVAARGDRASTAAVAAAYQECLTWGLRNAAALSSSAAADSGKGASGSSGSGADDGSVPAAAAAVGATSSSSSSSSVAGEEYCKQLLGGGHFSSLLQLALSSSSPDAQLAADIVQEVLLQQCASTGPPATTTSSSTTRGQLPLQLQVLTAAMGSSIQTALQSSCQQPETAVGEGDDEGTKPAVPPVAVTTVCLRLQQLLDALADSTARYSQAAAQQLAGACCAALLPYVQAGQQLSAPAANLLARLIREHPDAARLPATSSAATAAAGGGGGGLAAAGTAAAALSASGGSSSSSSIAALVRLGISSCTAGNDLAAADAELLLSCVAGSSDASVAWGMLLEEVAREGQVWSAWRFLEALLQQAASGRQLQACSSATAAAAAGSCWSHPLLDDYVTLLLQQLQQQPVVGGSSTGAHAVGGQDGSSDGSSAGAGRHQSWGLSRDQAAAASLLGCCLGANKQQAVLLSPAALAACMDSITDVLAATLQEQQQQQHQEERQGPNGAAAAFIAALCMALDSSNRYAGGVPGASGASDGGGSFSSSGSGNTLWQQQPARLSQVLLLVWQLAWGASQGGLEFLAALDMDSSSTYSGSGSDAGSDADSGSESSMSEDSSSSQADELEAAASAAGVRGTHGLGEGSSSSAAWRSVCAAASSIWMPEVVGMAVTELPAASASQLTQQLQQLLVVQLQEAAGEGACAGMDAAVAAGSQLACRAAVVLEGLQGHPEQQQQLAQELLGSAVDNWPRWPLLSAAVGDGNNSSGTSSVCGDGLAGWSPVHMLMLQLSAVLVLQAGCDVVLPLHHGHLLPHAASDAADTSGASSSSGSAGPDAGRLWLRLELLCASSALQQLSAHSRGSSTAGAGEAGFLRCVAAAAAAAERQLIRAAGKGSSGAASAVARSQLSAALGHLLTAAGSDAAAATEKSDLSVYGHTLQHLLARAVAASSASAAARAHLQPVLQQFVHTHVRPAVQQCISTGSSTATALLAPVLQQCAYAFRFDASGEAALAASGFAELSVQLMHAATSRPAANAGEGGSSGDAGLQQLLQLAVACFPIRQQHTQQQQHHHQQQVHQAQASAPLSTAAERKGLAAVLRTVCVGPTPGAAAATSSTTSSSTATTTPDAASLQLQCQLQLCCVSYCWAEMMAPEWHIVLRDAQQRLTTARREVEKAAGGLAGAVCSAAQQLLGARSSDDGSAAMSAAMAIQLLRRLEQKGLLQKQPAVAEALLAATTSAVQQLSQLAVLQPALEVVASVLQLQDRVQAAGRAPQLSLALSAAWRELLSLLLALGATVAVASSCGTACSSLLLQYCQDGGSTWLLLQQCLHGCSAAEGAAVGKVLAGADDKAEMLGVDAVGCCLALLQQGNGLYHHSHHHHVSPPQQQQFAQRSVGCEPLQQLAWELLLHPDSLASITHAATAAAAAADSEESTAAGGLPEYGVNDDAAAYLVEVGLRPEMAGGLASSRPWQMHMLLWALLLAHVSALRPRSSAQRRLCQALREVPELVPELLDRVASLMGLGGSSKGNAAAAAAAAGDAGSELPAAAAAAGGTLSAAAQASLSPALQAAGTTGSKPASPLSGSADAASSIWSVAVALRSMGLPHSHGSWRLLSAVVYRAVLCTLPASARLWFSDLRDRSRSTAVEAYTSKYESPALLAAEFAAIKRDAAGSSGEVGGSCSFRVVANPANREVTAVLEIEDGATLELVVKLPAAAPLKAPEVDCKNKVGIKDGRLRKWLLSIAVFLRNQNQGVLDGISMWKANLEQEFAGVEACLICYSVISAANGQLPRISCKQCNVKFHPACLYKWLRTSGKSTCPHCQALL